MKMQLELARSMSYYASLKLNAPAEERRRAMARAKYQLGVSMRFIGQNSVQLHGGIGVTDEYIGSHYFKKLTQLETDLRGYPAPPGRSVGSACRTPRASSPEHRRRPPTAPRPPASAAGVFIWRTTRT